ncbi:hypothetical protein SUGI_0629550 [Cryptomeria japonica]|nr:hypothetical protein SUGI_0629550 [Cryptomeria japonica]
MAVVGLPSLSILSSSHNYYKFEFLQSSVGLSKFDSNSRRFKFVVFANSAEKDSYTGAENETFGKKKKKVDTRIHWDNPDEGWIGVDDNNSGDSKEVKFGDSLSDLLLEAENSHYQFLGVAPNADLEEIKAAYRRLSKEYHPDSTSLPLETASMKFMRLREAYDVLSRDEARQFYDWSLARESSGRKVGGKFKQELAFDLSPKVPYKSKPDLVDRLGGKNMKLNDQALTALTFDVVAILFAIASMIYAAYFKNG